MQITLNKGEQITAKIIAKLRQKEDWQYGLKDQRVTNKLDSFTICLEGVGAEIAFCKLFNLYPDLSTTPHSGGADCLSHYGELIDVKSTQNSENPYLNVKITKKLEDADLYVLLIGKFPTYSIAGQLSSLEVIDLKNKIDYGYGLGKECYSIPLASLSPL
jgi:hypothetical protein